MPAPKLVKFDSAGGVPCYYARVNAAYGDLSLCTKSRIRRCTGPFLQRLSAMVQEINWVCYGALGELQAITSGGAWVPISKKRPKEDWHTIGSAYDLGGLHWKHHILTCLEVSKGPREIDQYLIYLAVESVIRKHFGTCLGIHYNTAHSNHWHIDPGTKVGYRSKGFGSKTRVRYLQEIMTVVWGIDCGNPNGVEGPKTSKAIKELRGELALGVLTDQNAWLQLLTVTSLKAMQLR